MLLDSWNQLLLAVPWPLWLPRWSLALVLPIIALLCYGVVSFLVPFLVPAARATIARPMNQENQLNLPAYALV